MGCPSWGQPLSLKSWSGRGAAHSTWAGAEPTMGHNCHQTAPARTWWVLVFLYSCSHLVCCSRQAQGGSLPKQAQMINSAQHNLPFSPGKPGSPAAPVGDKRKMLITEDSMRGNSRGSPGGCCSPSVCPKCTGEAAKWRKAKGSTVHPAGAATPAWLLSWSAASLRNSGKSRTSGRGNNCSVCWSGWGFTDPSQ